MKRRKFVKIIGVTTAGVMTPVRYINAEGQSEFDLNPATLITENDDFYILQFDKVPEIKADHWRMVVTGLVTKPIALNYQQILKMESVTTQRTLKCIGDPIGTEQMNNAEWTGVPLRNVLEDSGIKPKAKVVVFRCADGYHTAVPIERAMRKEVLLAYKMNGDDLPVEHGYPVRLLNPGHYGVKNPKWIMNIMLAEKHVGYWEAQGWDPIARVKLATVIRSPENGSQIKVGSVCTVSGAAFDSGNHGGIKSVEVSIDGGANWEPAEIWAKDSPLTWYLWKYTWQVTNQPGKIEIYARSTANNGIVQEVNGFDAENGGATGYHAIDAEIQT